MTFKILKNGPSVGGGFLFATREWKDYPPLIER